MSSKDLKKRWKKNDREKINQLIQRGGFFTYKLSPFELLNEGYIDLRGLIVEGSTLKNIGFDNIDFSFSSFKSAWIEKVTFSNCIFSDVDFSNFADHGNKFENCSFLDCKFDNAVIGYKGSNFLKCTFTTCSFQKTQFIRPECKSSNFFNCKIRNVDFNASSFEDCTFEGLLDDVWFRGGFALVSHTATFGVPKKNMMKNVSFEKADLRDPTFSDDCDLTFVKIKNNNRYYKYDNWNKRLQFLKHSIDFWDDEESKEAEIFFNTYSVHAKNQDWFIINMDDLERDYGIKVTAKIVERLNSFTPFATSDGQDASNL